MNHRQPIGRYPPMKRDGHNPGQIFHKQFTINQIEGIHGLVSQGEMQLPLSVHLQFGNAKSLDRRFDPRQKSRLTRVEEEKRLDLRLVSGVQPKRALPGKRVKRLTRGLIP